MTWTYSPVSGTAVLSLAIAYVSVLLIGGLIQVSANGKIAVFNQTLNSSLVLNNNVLVFNQSDFKKAFSFRTCSTHGQLLYQKGSNGDYFIVSVINGSLDIRWQAGTSVEAIHIGENLHDNRWYYINIYTLLGSSKLDVQQGSSLLHQVTLGNATYKASLWRTSLSIPGSLIIGQDFTGCVQQGPGVTFENNNALQSISVTWSNTTCPLDTINCNSDDNNKKFCWSSPCQNGATCIEGGNSFSCKCPPLYNGTLCDTDLSLLYGCEVTPCLNNGTCITKTGGTSGRNYECICEPGFNGVNCQVNINECGQNPCQNGGVCTDGINIFHCNCTNTGYEGITCSQNIDECMTNADICQNGGTCFDTPGSYDCKCPSGYQDKNCQELNECLSQPCKNGATCNDLLNQYACVCAPGFTGTNCDTNIDDCINVVCPGVNSECRDGVNTHTCVCKPGFTGTPGTCTDIQECNSNPCKNGGSCTEPEVNKYMCQCIAGYNGTRCEHNINDCAANPCQNNATCNDLINDFKCSCLPGYTGKTCSEDINECVTNNHPCKNGATCRNLLNAYRCDCVAGYTGSHCETDIDECSPDPCQNGATCHEYLYYYNCSCLPGYTGKNCSINIDDCTPNPCQNNGTCQDRVNGYECLCSAQWMGKTCSQQYNACAFVPCKNGATCMTAPPSVDYNCTCVAGFEDRNCSTNINECASSPCTAPLECFDGVNTYTCDCPTGYTGANCSVDINECDPNPCQNGATCIDLVGNYTCNCVQGMTNLSRYVSYPAEFVTGYKGRHCDEDINECAYPNPICLNGGKCENRQGDYQCYCTNHNGDGSYTLGHNCELSTTYCQVAEEAKTDPPACHHGGNCTAGDNTFTCSCTPGYTGRRCKIDINECESNPCQYGGTCNDLVAAFSCDCIPGITGEMCQIDIDECASNPCLHGGQCQDLINGLDGFDPSTLPPVYTVGYECNCTDTGFNGTECQLNIDDCASNPCQHGATCTDLIKDYNCTCYEGYTGKDCEIDIDECSSSPCQYNGTCLQHSIQNTYSTIPSLGQFSYANASGYSCLCISGITGSNCEINIDDCQNNTCEHNSTCVDQIDYYTCKCAPGYRGAKCEIDIDECELNACENGASCTDRVADYDCTCLTEKNSQGQLFSGKNCTFELTVCYPKNNPECSNNATCHPYLINEASATQGYTCQCQPGFTDRYCKTSTTASFNGLSSLAQRTLAQTTDNSISFRFRTTLPSVNLLVWMGTFSSRMFINLEIISGRLTMGYVTGTSQTDAKVSIVRIPVFVNDSKWHEIILKQETETINLTLNSENCLQSNRNMCTHVVPYLTTVPQNRLYFGKPSSDFALSKTKSKQPFKGCMEDIKVNSEIILPSSTSGGALTINITPGCPRTQQCFGKSTCSGHGRCYDFWDTFQCDCDRPFIGKRCEDEWTPATFAKDNTVSDVRFNIAALQEALKSRVDLSLFLRTREEMGLAVFLGNSGSSSNKTFMTIEIFNGFLASRLVLCNIKKYLVANNTEINNGNKHLVGVRLHNGVHQLLYDNRVIKEENIGNHCPFIGQVCYIGGKVPNTLRQQTQRRKRDTGAIQTIDAIDNLQNVVPYKGTIQDAQLNSNPMPFFAPSGNASHPNTNITIEDQTGLVAGEKSDDICNNTEPCMNNATCHNEFFNDFSCDCPRGFRGKNCSELDFCHDNSCPASATCQSLNDGFECIGTAHFDGSLSFVQLRPEISSGRKIDEISLMVRTIVKNAHLFSVTMGTDYIHFKIKGGRVMSLCKLGQTLEQVMMVDLNIADKRWHKIVLKEYASNITLMIISEFENKSSSVPKQGNSASFTSLISSTSNIILGKSGISFHYFKGCIKEPRIGGILLPFYHQTAFTNFTTVEYFVATQIQQIQHSCVEGSECGSNQCRHGAACLSDYYGYTCDCAGTGYEGFWCQNNINDCIPESCLNNGMCIDKVNNYSCTCKKPFYGSQCKAQVNVCDPNPCVNGGTCGVSGSDYSCSCPSDYTGRNCNVSTTAGCTPNPCAHGGSCNEAQRVINCTCSSFYVGPLCETRTDFCADFPCKNGATCSNDYNTGDYKCNCPSGYTGKNCTSDVDDCASSPCKNNGLCLDYVNGFNCNCTEGWTGPTCEKDFDECLTQPCQHNGSCINTVGTYQCNCRGTGYQGEFDCATDYNECNESPCANDGTCLNYDGGYNCTCDLGYAGENCTEVDCSQVDCNKGTCGRTPNGTRWQCTCNQYYYGKICNIAGPCSSNPCNALNTKTCTDLNITQQTYNCTCNPGWNGQNCDEDIDECTTNNPCMNGATCNNTQGSYMCICAPGYQGNNCEQDIDECQSSPCQNGQCENRINAYRCNCSNTGYTGDTCMEDIDECQLIKPCQNGGTCKNTIGSFECFCQPGFIHTRCEVADPSFQKLENKDNIWIIIGPVVAGILIIVVIGVIIFLMMARNKRATRGTYNPSRQEVIGSRVELGNVMKPPPEERLI